MSSIIPIIKKTLLVTLNLYLVISSDSYFIYIC